MSRTLLALALAPLVAGTTTIKTGMFFRMTSGDGGVRRSTSAARVTPRDRVLQPNLTLASPAPRRPAPQDMGDYWRAVAAGGLLAVKHFNERDDTIISEFGSLSSCDVQFEPIMLDTGSLGAPSTAQYLRKYVRRTTADARVFRHILLFGTRSRGARAVATRDRFALAAQRRGGHQ